MKIGIIGLGYVGLTLGIAAADSGILTYGVEINEKIKACLKQGKAHFYEPGLDNLIRKHNNRDFFCVERFPENEGFDAFVITVWTPLKKGQKEPEFSYIQTALKAIAHVYTGRELIILRSTVSVGTSRNVVLPKLAAMSGMEEKDLRISMCPERTVEGKAIDELRILPQIISGNNDDALETAENIFRKITPYVIKVDSLEEAELVKLCCNTYRDISFAIGNAFCMAAQTFGVDGEKVIRAANQGYERSNISLPGFVAGPCLEKDAYILTNNMQTCLSREFILTARKMNESLEDSIVAWVEHRIGKGNGGKVIAISGMAFKGMPETSDLRGSASVDIAFKLFQEGYKLHLHDYVADRLEMEHLKIGTVYGTLSDAVKDADILLILNNHRNYQLLSADEIFAGREIPALDVWGVCKNLYGSGADIHKIGNLELI